MRERGRRRIEGGAARRWRSAAACGAAVAAGACAALIQTPQVSVETVRVESVTLSGGTLTLGLRVTNPNNFELKGTAIDYTLRVAEAAATDPRWVDLVTGVSETGFTLPPLGSSEVNVPMRFDWLGVGAAVRQLMERGRLGYQVEGGVRVDLPGGLRRISFRQQGKVTT